MAVGPSPSADWIGLPLRKGSVRVRVPPGVSRGSAAAEPLTFSEAPMDEPPVAGYFRVSVARDDIERYCTYGNP